MDYRIEEKPSFSIAGIKKRVPIQFEGVNPEIEAMWETLDEQKIQELKQLSTTEPSCIIQASANFDEGRMDEKGNLDHYIGVATTRKIPDKWGRIYSEWLPSVNYELAKGSVILSKKDKDLSQPEVKCEIWIPENIALKKYQANIPVLHGVSAFFYYINLWIKF